MTKLEDRLTAEEWADLKRAVAKDARNRELVGLPAKAETENTERNGDQP